MEGPHPTQLSLLRCFNIVIPLLELGILLVWLYVDVSWNFLGIVFNLRLFCIPTWLQRCPVHFIYTSTTPIPPLTTSRPIYVKHTEECRVGCGSTSCSPPPPLPFLSPRFYPLRLCLLHLQKDHKFYDSTHPVLSSAFCPFLCLMVVMRHTFHGGIGSSYIVGILLHLYIKAIGTFLGSI